MTVHTPLRADDVRRSYARWAGHYDFTFALFGRKYVKKVVNRLNDETHWRNVLDVGTGTGLSLPYFRPDLSITGIDISEDMLARAEQRAKKCGNVAGLVAETIRDEILELPAQHWGAPLGRSARALISTTSARGHGVDGLHATACPPRQLTLH